jgi:hypothetical protein
MILALRFVEAMLQNEVRKGGKLYYRSCPFCAQGLAVRVRIALSLSRC